jgi:hypothetical protein
MNIPFRVFFVLWAVFGERYVDHFSAKRTCIPIVVFFPLYSYVLQDDYNGIYNYNLGYFFTHWQERVIFFPPTLLC